MLVLDQRTLAIKYRIPTSEFQALSLSPYSDRLAVFHLRKVRVRFKVVTIMKFFFNNSNNLSCLQ